MKNKRLFVVGTGTDIGKTYVTALLIKKMHDNGLSVAYYKAAMSGNDRREDGSLVPGDALHVKTVAGLDESLEEMCPYVYENALSPHLASRIEGNPVRLDKVMEGYHKVLDRYDYVVTEGSGGILCPIDYDNSSLWLEDIVKSMDAPTVLIADAGLGTINYVGLTAHYMQDKGIEIGGIIMNNYEDGNVMHEDNVKMCEQLTGLEVIGKVHNGDKTLDIEIEKILKLFR